MTVAQAAVDDVHLATDAAPTHVETNARQRETSLVLWCVDHVPSPTVPDYVFSQRQRVEQFCFFRDRLDLYPSRYLDLYNAAIVMALPENSTDDLCHLLHALVVAHVQPKLNVTTDDPEAMPVAGQSSTCWYEPLVHPRHCKIPRIN